MNTKPIHGMPTAEEMKVLEDAFTLDIRPDRQPNFNVKGAEVQALVAKGWLREYRGGYFLTQQGHYLYCANC